MPRPPARDRKNSRDELLADARNLFLTRGYTNTSIDEINRHAGLSKGTFYHYFKTKEELLNVLVEHITSEGWTKTRRAIELGSGGALERFTRFLVAARQWRIVALPQTAEIMRAVFRPENSLLRERMRDQSITLATPALARLLADGHREGVFRIEDSEATARVFLILAYGVSDEHMTEVMTSTDSDDAVLARLVAKGRIFMRATEAMLGLQAGTLDGPDADMLAGMIAAFRAETTP